MPPSTFYVISVSWPDSVGGGVVAEIFRDPHRRTRFSWGGGGRTRFSGGGVVAEIFRDPRRRPRFSGGG